MSCKLTILKRVSVADSGCGMTEETKKHIFEKFYQGNTFHATAGKERLSENE